MGKIFVCDLDGGTTTMSEQPWVRMDSANDILGVPTGLYLLANGEHTLYEVRDSATDQVLAALNFDPMNGIDLLVSLKFIDQVCAEFGMNRAVVLLVPVIGHERNSGDYRGTTGLPLLPQPWGVLALVLAVEDQYRWHQKSERWSFFANSVREVAFLLRRALLSVSSDTELVRHKLFTLVCPQGVIHPLKAGMEIRVRNTLPHKVCVVQPGKCEYLLIWAYNSRPDNAFYVDPCTPERLWNTAASLAAVYGLKVSGPTTEGDAWVFQVIRG